MRDSMFVLQYCFLCGFYLQLATHDMQNLVEPFTHQSTDTIGILLNPIASRFSGDYDGMTQQADGSYAAKWGSQRGIVYRSDMKPGKERLFLCFF